MSNDMGLLGYVSSEVFVSNSHDLFKGSTPLIAWRNLNTTPELSDKEV